MSSDHAYDALCDELAVTDPWEREHSRPSDFPTRVRVRARDAAHRGGPTSRRHRSGPACQQFPGREQ
jgi:hypothetical protein